MSYQTGLGNQNFKHKYLFPGASCFPLSPSSKSIDEFNDSIVSKSDQMKVILDTIGIQDEEDLNFVTDAEAKSYVQTLQNKKFKLNFKDKFPQSNIALHALLHDML
jgi:hypothetical protein